ncbi:hypothetical protein BGP77_08135 [Saccharospirillum sp. MSK14-1]|uniref:ABC transporter ATP-binding protein n=1 Tax=Saccharospirillum sp. MSK14-1 TaxID=1897632 RepID=UPI000D3A16C3|nr:ATP-binding cassette domain-containing protein [Saccharospirillum sp. MSK14-1]PTY37223.1 hypothetical protein BGP77_08135 [Saccharospirillum sp. MSK14-1]
MLQLIQLSLPRLAPLELTVAPGQVLGLSGPSGSGKTRLLRALADLDPHGGEICLDNTPQTAFPAHDWRRQVMLVPAESQWWSDSVAEHFPERRVVDWQALGFDRDPSDWTIDRLSTGEKQRLSLLRAMAYQPRVVLLDEPTANLDERSRAMVETWLLAAIRSHHKMAIWVSHDDRQLRRVADQCLSLGPASVSA